MYAAILLGQNCMLEMLPFVEKGKRLKNSLKIRYPSQFPLISQADIKPAYVDATQFNRVKSEHEPKVVLFGSLVRFMPYI